MWRAKPIRYITLFAGLCAAFLFTCVGQAQNGSSKPGAWQVSVQREPVDYAEPYYRAFITAGTTKLTFLLPQGFRVQAGSAEGMITLINAEGNSTITFGILGSMSDSGQLSPDSYRESLMKLHPTGKVTSEFTSHAAGRSGPGFDVAWKATAEITQCKRVIYIPSKMGIMQFAVITGSTQFVEAKANFGQILSTIAYSTDGKLKINYLSGAN